MIFDLDIANALISLKEGKTILYPTDTVWGIGCDATNELAVSAIYKIKERKESKSLVLLVDSIEMLQRIIKIVPEKAIEMIEKTEKPITIIYDAPLGIAKNVIAEDNTVAIRIVKDEFCKKLIEEFGKPIVSTSANKSGEPTPQSFNSISHFIKQKVDFMVLWRQEELSENKPSTIVKIDNNNQVIILRN